MPFSLATGKTKMTQPGSKTRMAEDRKKSRRQEESNKIRERRVICGYLEIRHPQIYKEGLEFYNFLNSRHPEKKDLRKTNDFEMLKKGVEGQKIKRYYGRKEKYVRKRKNSDKKDMELIIPLTKLPVSVREIRSSSNVSTPEIGSFDHVSAQEIEIPAQEIEIPAQEIEIPAQEIEIPAQEIEILAQEIEIPAQEIEIPAQEIQVSNEVSLGHIPDQIVEDIMASLREDPDLHVRS